MSRPDDRDDALAQIRALAQNHGLTEAEIIAALRRSDADPGCRSSLLSRILAMLGAIFVFAGISVFVGLNWDRMNSAARIVVTLGSGIAVFILAVLADRDERYARAVTPLYFIAAVLQPVGLAVAIEEFFTGEDWHVASLAVSGVMAAQQLGMFYARRRPVLLFSAVVFVTWLLVTVLDWIDVDGELIAVLIGGSVVALCVGLGRTRYANLTPVLYFAGAVAFYAGSFAWLDDTWIELAVLALGCGGVFLSTIVRSRVLLAVATLAILGFITDFTMDRFVESLGWPIVLIVLGLLLIVLSGVAMRINRRYIGRDEGSRAMAIEK